MDATTKLIVKELKSIRKDLVQIKASLPDKEMFLTAAELALLEQSYEHERQGKLMSSGALRKELGI